MVIVGLGNPDEKYLGTYHNVGFICVDAIAHKLNIPFDKNECKAVVGLKYVKDEKIVVAKPLTYMNLSGLAVRELVGKYTKTLKDLIVVYDDIDIPFATVRVRENGSAGTHNGMRSIIGEIGEDFPRIRIGIGKSEKKEMALADYVLSTISTEKRAILDKTVEFVSAAIATYLNDRRLDKLMQCLNAYKPI